VPRDARTLASSDSRRVMAARTGFRAMTRGYDESQRTNAALVRNGGAIRRRTLNADTLVISALKKSFGGSRRCVVPIDLRTRETHALIGENGAAEHAREGALGRGARRRGEILLNGASLRVGSPLEARRAA